MKRNVYMKSTLRQPARTLFLLLLVGFISFSFISRTSEFIIIRRETDRLSEYYRAIGYLRPVDEDGYDVSKGAELVAKSRYVAYEDRQRFTSGVLEGLLNADVDGCSSDYEGNLYPMGVHVSDVMIYGMLTDKKYNETLGEYGGFELSFKVDKVEAGYPEYVGEGKTVRLLFLLDESNAENLPAPTLRKPGEKSAQGKDTEVIVPENTPVDGMEVGGRYFVKASYQFNMVVSWTLASNNLVVMPLNGDGLWFVPVEAGESVDFTAPALKELGDELAVLRENQSAMRVIATKDMSAIPSVQQVSRYCYLAEGRWLTLDDDLKTRHVCVVNSEFANMRGLSVGDTVRIKLRDLKNDGYLGYIVDGYDTWQEDPTSEQEFEIVGLYGLVEGGITSENVSMYIPDSCMPAEFNEQSVKEPSLSSYSFVLKSPQDQDAFLNESEAALKALGLKVRFVKNNAEGFWASVTPLLRSAAVNAAVFGLVLVLALALAAFLYLRQRRRELAILRALGMPRKTAVCNLFYPIALIGGMGILAGGLLSWNYTIQKATQTLASVITPEGVTTSAALSLLWLLGLCAMVFLLLLVFVWIGAKRLARRPTLELLQGETGHAGHSKKMGFVRKGEEPAPQSSSNAVPSAFIIPEMPRARTRGGFAASVRYVFRHIRRSPYKSIMLAAVALCFTLALGWMNAAIEQNAAELPRMYANYVVEAEIICNNPSMISSAGYGIIHKNTVETVMNSGYVQSTYLEASAMRAFLAVPASPEKAEETKKLWDEDCKTDRIELRAFDDPETFFAPPEEYGIVQVVSGIGTTITKSTTLSMTLTVEYAEGFDESLFTEQWTAERLKEQKVPVVLSVETMDLLDLKLGGAVYIVDDNNSAMEAVIAGQYSGAVTSGGEATPVLLPLSALGAVEETQGRSLGYAVAQFVLDPQKNRELPEFRTEMRAAVTRAGAGDLPLNLVIWDEELQKVVEPLEKNLQLMSVLYPITIALSALIAGGLCVLLMLQNAKDAAIMRVLGTGRLRARITLVAEQVFLCLAGLALGLAGLALLKYRVAAPALINAGLCLAGALAGSCSASFVTTNRKPLEMLQVKE